MDAYLRVRGQHAKTGKKGFPGPNTYVSVVIMPEGVKPPKHNVHAKIVSLGGKIEYFGEGYAKHRSLRSALGKAIQAAETFVWEQNFNLICDES